MTQSTSHSPPAYTPESEKPPSRTRALLAYQITAKDLLSAGVALLAIVGALGWTFSSPGKRIEYLSTSTAARFDTTNRRVDRTERRIDTLAESQRFTNYLLCTQIRRTDPAATPPDCAPIIESRNTPRRIR